MWSRSKPVPVPRPNYSAWSMRFGSHCPSEFLSIPAVRLGYVSEMNCKKAGEEAAQGIGKGLTTRRCGSVYLVVIVSRGGEVVLCV